MEEVNAVYHYLDIEASVDSDPSDDEQEEFINDFIDDDNLEVHVTENEYAEQLRWLADVVDNNDFSTELGESVDDVDGSLVELNEENPEPLHPIESGSSDATRRDDRVVIRANNTTPVIPTFAAGVDSFWVHTLGQVWAIKCRPKTELLAVAFIQREAEATGNPLRIKEVWRRQQNDGYIYVAVPHGTPPGRIADMAKKCVWTIKKSLIRDPLGIEMHLIHGSDEILTTVPVPCAHIKPGDWAVMRYPKKKREPEFYGDKDDFYIYTYHHDGEPALVMRTDLWASGVQLAVVLVVPHIARQDILLGTTSAKLLPIGPIRFGSLHFRAPRQVKDMRPKLMGSKLRHGLNLHELPVDWLVKKSDDFDFKDVGPFIATQDPWVLQHFPKIRTWNFEVDDRVTDWLGQFEGVVTSVTDDGLRSLMSNGLTLKGWGFKKIWRIGDYVRHVGQDKEGWVTKIEEMQVHFTPVMHWYNPKRDLTIDTEPLYATQEIYIAHPNSLVRSTVPYLHRQPEEGGSKSTSNTIRILPPKPWIHTIVQVTKGRKCQARVLDVRKNSANASGLEVQCASNVIGANGCWFTVDYDAVVEWITGKPLHIYSPLQDEHLQYTPRATYRHRHEDKPLTRHSDAYNFLRSGRAGTPVPADSATDPWILDWEKQVGISYVTQSGGFRYTIQRHPTHEWLISHAPLNIKFRVRLTGTRSDKSDDEPFENESVKLWVTEYLNLRVLTFKYKSGENIVSPTLAIEPVVPRPGSQHPFIVIRGPGTGAIVAKVGHTKNNEGLTLNVVEVNVTTATVLGIFHDVQAEDCCMIEMDDEEMKKLLQQNLKGLRQENSQRTARTHKQ